ncbi:type II/IV secretion system ATPase subunit [Metallosphaera hakonensis]|uniref:Type II secretion system protein VirB n=1 Tax=Metallosphaera hakonensis JCM 8857 = DSM 7519 TaxID=1293036 RepID=A0A2U9IUH2_9CREN|nr:type II/IV secretion system ATPase subunit [Metallosphaera hakonensis]AWR99633.1 type II secretion system protein VirB [Metallosphaera hakonensis JCM 8857 = DSM 7519]
MGRRILEEYSILGNKVSIIDDDGRGLYIVEKKKSDNTEQNIVNSILDEVYFSSKTTTEAESKLIEIITKKNLDRSLTEKAMYELKKKLLYDEITVPISDPDIEEIECMGPGLPITVIHRKYSNYIRLYTNIVINREEEILKIIEKLATRASKSVSIAKPYLEFSLPEGHRVAATISNEISNPGSTFDIRKFPVSPISLVELIKSNSLSVEMASYLWLLMEYKPFYLIVGSTGSGKTTMLNALLNFTSPDSKILSIEDTPELNLIGKNWIRFFSRQSLASTYDVSIGDLSRLALRYRPDYLIIGEVRGKEIETLIHASSSGHGSFSTFHGGKPSDVVTRVVSLLPKELAIMFLNSIWGFILVGRRLSDGKVIKAINAIYETQKTNGKIRFKRILWYSFKTKRYEPNDFSKILKTSEKLKYIQTTYGYRESDLLNELNKRKQFLTNLIDSNIVDNGVIQEEIGKFYRGMSIYATATI